MQACRGQALPSWLGGIIHPRGSRLFYSIGHRQAGFWGWQQASGADSWAAGFGARLCAAAAAAAPPSAPQHTHTHTQPQQFSIFPPSLSALAPRGRVVASAVQVAIAEARNSWSNRRFEAPPPTMVISNTIHGKRHAVQAGSEAGPSAPGGSQSSGFPDTMQLKLANSLRYPAPAAPTCPPRPPPPPRTGLASLHCRIVQGRFQFASAHAAAASDRRRARQLLALALPRRPLTRRGRRALGRGMGTQRPRAQPGLTDRLTENLKASSDEIHSVSDALVNARLVGLFGSRSAGRLPPPPCGRPPPPGLIRGQPSHLCCAG